MTAAYPTAAIPEPFQILGLRLKPFCLGHYLLMERFGVAFVSPTDAVATFEDLILGVLICSMTYEEFMSFLFEPDHEEQVRDWGKDIQEFDLNEKCKLFNDYIVKGSEQPTFIYETEGKTSGAHWAQMIKLALTGELGYTASEAVNLPLAQAFHEVFKNAENKGIVTMATPEQIAMMEAANQPPPAEVPHG